MNVPAVFVLSNGSTAKFHGHTTCKNAWACPVCTAKVMAKHAENIAIGIDLLAAKGQLACMITFTVPHTSGMSCKEVYNILCATWKDFVVHGNKNSNAKYYRQSGGVKSMVVSSHKQKDPFASFCEHFNCKHRVKVAEFTYGEHGWHPHFHCLFWVDKSKFDEVVEWQDRLNTRWYVLAKRNTIKEWDKIVRRRLGKSAEDPEAIRKALDDAKKNNRVRAQIMYSKLDKGSAGVYISRADNGRPVVQKSSMYICGWGADRELTGNVGDKATHDGHVTPRQLLERATLEDNDENAKLYLEYMRAVRGTRRVAFSTQSGLRKMIEQYKQTEGYRKLCLKKNATNPNLGLRVVTWFNIVEWRQICCEEILGKMNDIKVKILEHARDGDIGALENLLIEIGVDIRNKPEHKLTKTVEEVFASVA